MGSSFSKSTGNSSDVARKLDGARAHIESLTQENEKLQGSIRSLNGRISSLEWNIGLSSVMIAIVPFFLWRYGQKNASSFEKIKKLEGSIEELTKKNAGLKTARDDLCMRVAGLEGDLVKEKKFGMQKIGKSLLEVADNFERFNKQVSLQSFGSNPLENRNIASDSSCADHDDRHSGSQGTADRDGSHSGGQDTANSLRAESDSSPQVNLTSLFEAVQLTHANFTGVLARHGIEKQIITINSSTFDPDLHEAVYQCPDTPRNVVSNVEREGYCLNGRVLRPARVGVGSNDDQIIEVMVNDAAPGPSPTEAVLNSEKSQKIECGS